MTKHVVGTVFAIVILACLREGNLWIEQFGKHILQPLHELFGIFGKILNGNLPYFQRGVILFVVRRLPNEEERRNNGMLWLFVQKLCQGIKHGLQIVAVACLRGDEHLVQIGHVFIVASARLVIHYAAFAVHDVNAVNASAGAYGQRAGGVVYGQCHGTLGFHADDGEGGVSEVVTEELGQLGQQHIIIYNLLSGIFVCGLLSR